MTLAVVVVVVVGVVMDRPVVGACALGLASAVGAVCGSGGCTWLVLGIAVGIVGVGAVVDRVGRFLCIIHVCL